MKILTVHDGRGNIDACVVQPPNAPPVAMSAAPGQVVSEVEAREVRIDLDDPESLQRLVDVVRNFRVEVKTEARLVRINSPKSG